MIKAEWAKILDGAGFQAAAICVCIVCIYYLMVKTKPEKFRNKLFLILVLNVLIGALCNFISAILKSYLNVSDAAYNVRMICQYIYFIIHPMLAPLFCFYISIVTGANYKLKKYRLISEIPAAFMFLLALINPITNWVYYFTENREFHRNWAENILYGISLVYYIFAIVMLLLFWDAINTNVRRVMIFFFIFVAVGLGLQFMFASLHTELFAEAIALSGIMIIIENEEGRKDSRTHIYNHAALAYDIKQYIKVRHSFFMICIKMKNPIGLMQLMGNANIETLTELTAEYLSTLVPKYSIYYIGTGTFVIVNENDDRDYNIGIAKAIKERFNHSWHFQDRDTTFNAAVFCAEIPTDLKSYKEISMLINGPIPTEGINEDIIYYGSSLNYVLRRSQVEEAIRNGMEKKNFEVFSSLFIMQMTLQFVPVRHCFVCMMEI